MEFNAQKKSEIDPNHGFYPSDEARPKPRYEDTAELPILNVENEPTQKAVLDIEQIRKTKKPQQEGRRGLIILTCMVAFAFLLAIALIISAFNSGGSNDEFSESKRSEELEFTQAEKDESDALILQILDQYPAFKTARQVAEVLGIEEEELARWVIEDSNEVISELNKKRQELGDDFGQTFDEISNLVEDIDTGEIVENIDPRQLLDEIPDDVEIPDIELPDVDVDTDGIIDQVKDLIN